MTLIRFTDAQLHELMQAARMVPPDLRDIFLGRVAVELQGKPLSDASCIVSLTTLHARLRGTPSGRR